MWMQPSLRPEAGDENRPGHKRFHFGDILHRPSFSLRGAGFVSAFLSFLLYKRVSGKLKMSRTPVPRLSQMPLALRDTMVWGGSDDRRDSLRMHQGLFTL
jgi:hypothetical protein